MPHAVNRIDTGRGPPVLFLHGIPDSAEAWAGVIARLGPGVRCIAPDLPGFGDGAVPAGFEPTLPHMARFVEDVIAAAGVREPVTLVVHDVGGAFGLAWALRDPGRVGRLVVLNTAFFSDRRWHWGARILRTPGLGEAAMALLPRRAFVRSVRRAALGNLSPAAINETCDRFGRSARRMALRLYRALDPAVFRGWEDGLPDLAARVPVLVLWGEGDPYLPPAFADRFGARRVVRWPDCGHWPHRERPDRVAAALRAFLGEG